LPPERRSRLEPRDGRDGAGNARIAGAILGACACLFPPSARAGDIPPPFSWEEAGGLQRLFLQLPFEAPSVAAPRTFEGEVRLIYSNTILVEAGPRAAIDVDLESAFVTGFLRYGIAPGLEVELALPMTLDYGGFLDGPIEAVEGLFNAANPARKTRPRGLTRFDVSYLGKPVRVDGAEAGVGDAWLGLKNLLLDAQGPWPALALRAALKLPTGRYPFGSGEVDVGGSAFAGWTLHWLAVRLQVDAEVPTANLRAVGIPTQPYGSLHLGFTALPWDSLAFQLQVTASTSPLKDTWLYDIDAGVRYLLLGVSVALSRSTWLDVGLEENVWSPNRGLDFAIFLATKGRL